MLRIGSFRRGSLYCFACRDVFNVLPGSRDFDCTGCTYSKFHHPAYQRLPRPTGKIGSNPGMAERGLSDHTAAGGSGWRTKYLSGGWRRRDARLAAFEPAKRPPVIAAFNAMGYSVATFGNHEFDWGQTNLIDRTTQATYPFVTRQHRQERYGQLQHRRLDSSRPFTQPYVVEDAQHDSGTVKVGFIGVTTTETPTITVATATAGSVLQGPGRFRSSTTTTRSKALADVIIVLSHLGL